MTADDDALPRGAQLSLLGEAPVRAPAKRVRARALGLRCGRYKPGRLNAITDVAGVKVGHSTIVRGEGRLAVGEGPVRTGVTAILPNDDVYMSRVTGGAFILNGAGEISGLTQVLEWGLIETPILLTNTLSVGSCSEACVRYLVRKYPGVGSELDVMIPLVAECDDSWLNDVAGNHVREEHVLAAIETAKGGAVEEGSVGGGTGMISCDFKAGIGTASRRLDPRDGGFTIGVLVMSNFGVMENLRMNGVPIGALLAPNLGHVGRRVSNYGSIIAVLATDAPLVSTQLTRLAKRVALGIGRTGSYAAHGSGEIVLAFSTANAIPRETRRMVYRMKVLLDVRLDPLYEATIEATEEAIANAMTASPGMQGQGDHFVPGLPLDEVRELLERWQP